MVWLQKGGCDLPINQSIDMSDITVTLLGFAEPFMTINRIAKVINEEATYLVSSVKFVIIPGAIVYDCNIPPKNKAFVQVVQVIQVNEDPNNFRDSQIVSGLIRNMGL